MESQCGFRNRRATMPIARLVTTFAVLLLLPLVSGESVVTSAGVSASGSKTISINLNAKWHETPLYMETSEYLAEENPDLFWSFIEAIQADGATTADGVQLAARSPRAEYETALRLADPLLGRSPARVALLKFSLALRSHSPTIVMHNQMALDVMSSDSGSSRDELPTAGERCDAFIHFSRVNRSDNSAGAYGREDTACDMTSARRILNDLHEVTNAATDPIPSLIHPATFKTDHVYPLGGGDGKIVAILYGDMGTGEFMDLHKFLTDAASSGKLKYVTRHFVRRQRAGKVSLSGWGVELAIKSTEYKAQDDTRVKGEETSETHALQQEEAVKSDQVDGFVFSKLRSTHPDLAKELNAYQEHLSDSAKEIATLKVWELQELSLQAAQKIMSESDNPIESLKLMRDLAQNFPTMARSLAKVKVSADLKREVEKNQEMFSSHLNLSPQDTALFINGMYYDVDTMDMFTMLHILKQETRLTEGIHRLVTQIRPTPSPDEVVKQLENLLKLDIGGGSDSEKTSENYQLDIRDSAVMYINDIEQDKMYKNWPSSLNEMLRPTYPGMLRNVRKNLYHLILVIDPAKLRSHDVLRMAESFYVHKAPVRIGFIFSVNRDETATGLTDGGIAALNAFNFISQDKTPYDGLSFLTDAIASIGSESRDLTSDDILKLFKGKYPKEDFDLIFGADSDYDTGRRLAWDFIRRSGMGTGQRALLNGVILKESHLNADLFEEAVLTEIMRQTPTIQKAIYMGKLQDSDDPLDWLMTQPNVLPRLNRRIIGGGGGGGGGGGSGGSSDEVSRYVDFSGTPQPGSLDGMDSLSDADLTATLLSNDDGRLTTINPSKKTCPSITLWLSADLSRPAGRDLLASAVTHLRENSLDMRLALIHSAGPSDPISRGIEAASRVLNTKSLLSFLTKLTLESNVEKIFRSTASNDQIAQLMADLIHDSSDRSTFLEAYQRLSTENGLFELHQHFARRVLGVAPGTNVLVINGKIIRIPEGDNFILDDFNLIERYVTSSYGHKLAAAVQELFKSPGDDSSESDQCSDTVMKLSAVLLANPQSKTRHSIKQFGLKHSVIQVPPTDPSRPVLHIAAIVDPASRGAQKLAPILLTLTQVVNAQMRIYLNCIEKHSDMPLKSFFRFVLDSEPFFGTSETDGGVTDSYPQWMAYFSSMPVSPLLTLGMMTPENWLVESVRSPYDLDNIHLEEVTSGGVWANFELEHLLMEGHCFEQSTGTPPRGLQFILKSRSHEKVVQDTIVMANLGYYQLKANPGAWRLELREGRSSDLYDIVSHENTDTPVGHGNDDDGSAAAAAAAQMAPSDVTVLMNSFRSRVIKVRVNKKPDKQHEELLYDPQSSETPEEDEINSIWSSFGSWGGDDETGQRKKKNQKETKDVAKTAIDPEEDRLNIFSVASGHLYERLLRIMMISVIKNTKAKVKFWFLKNYLSPTFKRFLPHYAETYGFEYELVEYKWPRWLHQQTEKQRIIWGYKILFLDVLFPLNIKKIIFVDADQVIRTDLRELRDMDLEGAPYGFTPFCDSRHDMDGFRFWKQGYWQSHLHGRKYHISALYVVDLVRFRRLAAGDRLRGQYQGLSQDPNSLANLDQDLPNNMIHQVSIKSLSQEWLWCETWCDDESKVTAKTIDLCNNPKTKEPKLTAARRILPEWSGYDDEIRSLMNKWLADERSQPAIADGNILVPETELDPELMSSSIPDPTGSQSQSGSHTEL